MLLLTMLSLITLIIAISVGQIAACLTISAGTAICSGMVPYSVFFGAIGVICIPVAISVHFEVKNRERGEDRQEAP